MSCSKPSSHQADGTSLSASRGGGLILSGRSRALHLAPPRQDGDPCIVQRLGELKFSPTAWNQMSLRTQQPKQ